MEEGVQFRFLNAPVSIEGKDGKVTALKVEIRGLGEPDEKGRRKPVGTGKFETIAVSSVIAAIGQMADPTRPRWPATYILVSLFMGLVV